MCAMSARRICVFAATALFCLNLVDAFWLPVFYSKKAEAPQSPAVGAASGNAGWGRGGSSHMPQHPSPSQSQYKDYYMTPQASMHMPMNSMQMPLQQYSYDPSPVMMSPYRPQMQYMEPQFQNVKLVPCMCPLTQDLIDQHTQGMMQSSTQGQGQGQAQGQVQPGPESTKLTPTHTSNPSS